MPKKPNDDSYKNMSAKLDELMAWFEQPELDIDGALLKYEETMDLIKKMEAFLRTSEVKLTKINKRFDT